MQQAEDTNLVKAEKVISRAWQFAIGGLVVALVIVNVLSLKMGRNYDILFARVGQAGDVTGGITGPILNFCGMLIVFYSLREQLRANNIQNAAVRHELKSSAEEAILKSTEHLIDAAKESLHIERHIIVDITNRINHFDQSVGDATSSDFKRRVEEHSRGIYQEDDKLLTITVLISTIYDRIQSKGLPTAYELYIVNLFFNQCIPYLPNMYRAQKHMDLDHAPNYRRLFNIALAVDAYHRQLAKKTLKKPIAQMI